MLRTGTLLAIALVTLTLLQGCTCCVYYNHMFNAERAWKEGLDLQKARVDSMPNDSIWVSQQERIKYDRVIEKCSRVLERFPDDVDSKPRAVFLIAESYRKKGEWSKAIGKYDEFDRYFSDHDSMPAVEYQRAFCLYKNGDFAVSRFALDRVLAKGDQHIYHADALQLLSLLEERANMPTQAIDALEKLLASNTGTPFMRGKMHLRLADLYYRQDLWQKARDHYRAKEIDVLDLRDRLVASTQGVECLVSLKSYSDAALELAKYEKQKEYESQLSEMRVRRGEILLLAQQTELGLSVLLNVAKSFPKTNPSARAWYNLGDFEQLIRKNYPIAIQHYDSSWGAWPSSEWGKKSRARRDALNQLITLQKRSIDTTAKKLTRREEFQIAELFLFRLSEVDSAIHMLDRIAKNAQDSSGIIQDSAVLQRAFYARAFIYDEFKKDSLHSDSLYRDIVKRFPGTEFAKQAQANLGVRITEKTATDLAHEAFVRAESLWVSISLVPVDSFDLIDTLFARCVLAYDSIYIRYPNTEYAPRALYAKAWIIENQGGQLDTARITYNILRNKYGDTKWGRSALEKLQPRLLITDSELERLRKRVEQNDQNAERLRKQYEDDLKNSREVQKKKDLGPSVDEVLENDYNSLYDFQ
jgi:tetratricopeptide (TPR) repeat protein